MNTILGLRLKHKLQKELINRSLNKFFIEKGYDRNFEMPLYPPLVYDISIKIPHLFNRCEVIPTVEETDTTLGIVRITWNLFVLGTQRLDLGMTTHTGHSDLVQAIAGEPNTKLPATRKTTPEKVIQFILRVLSSSKSGFIELPDNFQVPLGALTLPLLAQTRTPRLNNNSSSSFYR